MMMTIPAKPWVEARLASGGVAEREGKWEANLRGVAVGSFATKAEALKAYRNAAEKMFGKSAALPAEADIDAVVESL